MASPNTEKQRMTEFVEELARGHRGRTAPPPTPTPRDRSLRGKARTRARRAANRQETNTDA